MEVRGERVLVVRDIRVDHEHGIETRIGVEDVSIQSRGSECLVGLDKSTRVIEPVTVRLPSEDSAWPTHSDVQVKGRMKSRQDIWDDAHLVNTLHEHVELSLCSPPLLEEMTVRGLAHVDHRVADSPANVRKVDLGLNLENLELLAHLLEGVGVVLWVLLELGNGGLLLADLLQNLARVSRDVFESLVVGGHGARREHSIPLPGTGDGNVWAFLPETTDLFGKSVFPVSQLPLQNFVGFVGQSAVWVLCCLCLGPRCDELFHRWLGAGL